jgi:GT2 family glycosyltransferase
MESLDSKDRSSPNPTDAPEELAPTNDIRDNNSPARLTLAIIAVSFFSDEEIKKNLPIFKSLHDKGVSIIVVSNSPATDSLRADYIVLSEMPRNVGFARACNAGAKLAAHCDYLLFVNPDTVLTEDMVLMLLDLVHANPAFGTISPAICYKPTHVSRLIRVTDRDINDNIGACFIISAQLFQKLHGFDESYFLWWEDTDFAERVSRSGFRVGYADGLTLMHNGAHSTKGETRINYDTLGKIWISSCCNYRLKYRGRRSCILYLLAIAAKTFIGSITTDSLKRQRRIRKCRFTLLLLRHSLHLEKMVKFDGRGFVWAEDIEEALRPSGPGTPQLGRSD